LSTFTYDLLRAFRSRMVLLMMALTVGLSLIILLLGLPVLVSNGDSTAALNLFVVSAMGTLYGFFVPMLGIVAGYETYSKERITGVLDSVLCRPVTRGSLITARFLAVLLAAMISIGLALGLVDAVVYAEASFLVDPGDLLAIYAALVVEVAAFGGLSMLLAHVFRSTGAVQGFSAFFFVIFSIIWYVVVIILVLVVGVAPSTIVLADFFNPAQYSQLVNTYIQKSLFFGFFIASPSWIGLVVSGALWFLVPFLIAYRLATKRD
jgi:ABC-2 type transport system permease protein